ncbi:MAG TPA: branched-chain amino acid ABC transporter permease [Actinomycetota bacterium]|nr:branched-chain amino acid ABC transporter permease [Actinomycetota bacterium]
MAEARSGDTGTKRTVPFVWAALRHRRALGWGAAVALTAYLVYAPEVLLESFQRTLAGVFMFATLALAWNLIGGMAGYPSFGNVVFFGLGGYTVASLMARAGWTFWPALVLAAVFGAVFAALVGLPVLRLRGHYFAIATLGVAEGMRELVINVPRITGGGSGITIPAVGTKAATPYPGNTGFYYYFLVLLLTALLVVWRVSRSRFGYALRAIREEEDGAAAMGVNTTRTKVAAFALSGFLTAVAGGLYAFQQVTIYPERSFSVEITVLMVVMVVIGGIGTVLGPLLGGVGLQFLSEYLRQNYLQWNLFIFGAIVVVAVIFLPEGAVRFAGESWRRRRPTLLANVRQYRL